MGTEYLRSLLAFTQTPNNLGFCGPKSETKYHLLDEDVWDASDIEKVQNFMHKFDAMMAYLNSFSKFLKVDVFDDSVIQAYLIGADANFWNEFDVSILKKELLEIAIEPQKDRIRNLPTDVPLTHNFHVLYLGPVAKEIPELKAIENYCKVSLGRVEEGGEICYNKLLPSMKVEDAYLDFKPFPDLKTDDYVFSHYKTIFKKATPYEVELYKTDFQKVLDFVKNS